MKIFEQIRTSRTSRSPSELVFQKRTRPSHFPIQSNFRHAEAGGGGVKGFICSTRDGLIFPRFGRDNGNLGGKVENIERRRQPWGGGGIFVTSFYRTWNNPLRNRFSSRKDSNNVFRVDAVVSLGA